MKTENSINLTKKQELILGTMILSNEANRGTSVDWISAASGIKDKQKVKKYLENKGFQLKDDYIFNQGRAPENIKYSKTKGYHFTDRPLIKKVNKTKPAKPVTKKGIRK